MQLKVDIVHRLESLAECAPTFAPILREAAAEIKYLRAQRDEAEQAVSRAIKQAKYDGALEVEKELWRQYRNQQGA